MIRLSGCKSRALELYGCGWVWAGSILRSLGLKAMTGVKVESLFESPVNAYGGGNFPMRMLARNSKFLVCFRISWRQLSLMF